jgi:hypothetical protein
MKKENYLPFDLETALKHPERVVTRDGRKVYYFKHLDKIIGDYPLIGVVDGKLRTFALTGHAYVKGIEPYDLFLLPEVKECWVNIYELKGKVFTGRSFATKIEAKENIYNNENTYIKTIRITNEPE